jgi:succinate dehydrogenase hydrophobic anchor subunit
MVAAMEAMGFEESEQVAVLRATAAVRILLCLFFLLVHWDMYLYHASFPRCLERPIVNMSVLNILLLLAFFFSSLRTFLLFGFTGAPVRGH